MSSKNSITIGYYPLRGKAQVCRLLCEYLNVNYKDKLFSLQQWDAYKKQKINKFSHKELPYLEEGTFMVTGSIPMCLYIIDRFGSDEMLGKDIRDKAIVDMYIWTIDSMSGVINLNCQKKSQEEIIAFKEEQWNNIVSVKLQKYQEFIKGEQWFLGYLTIIDFSIYELINYMDMLFPQKVQQFPKLLRIRDQVASIAQITSYEHSERAVREMCPTSLLKKLKQKVEEGSAN